MIGLASLLIWASTSLGVFAADAKNESCFSDFSVRLKAQISNEGWNDLGRGFLGIFTPAKLTDEHWESIGRIKKGQDVQDNIKKVAMSMGGVVFLIVVSVLLILCFCAAPCSLCVYSCTCKKKCKPKSNAIIAYTGIACNSVAILTIGLSILFCYLSIDAFTYGVGNIPDATKPLPDLILGAAQKFKKEIVDCVGGDLVSDLKTELDNIPKNISETVVKIPKLEAVMKINLTLKQDKIDDFKDDSKSLADGLLKLHPEIDGLPTAVPDNVKADIKSKIDLTKAAMMAVHDELKDRGGKKMKEKLIEVEASRKKAEQSEIEATIREKMSGLSDKIANIQEDVNKQIEEKFKDIDSVKHKINNSTKPMYAKIDEYKEKFGYAKALNLLLFPCYLALVSAIWSCCQATKFVQKKKAKPKEKLGLLIPLAIGLCLAFLPLLVTDFFMMGASVTNVACGTIFKDDKGILPRLLTTFEVETKIKNKDVELDLLTVIQECSAGKPLLAAVNGSQMIAEDLLIKQFDIDKKKAEMANDVRTMNFGLPTAQDWDNIGAQIGEITTKKTEAKANIDALGAIELPPANKKLTEVVKEVGNMHKKLNDFVDEVTAFEKACTEDIATAKLLTEDDIRSEIGKKLAGDGTPRSDMLTKMQDALNQQFLAFRTDLLEKSTSCKFVFDLFTDVGSIICDQALGGLNGVYAAMGLGVMSFFSATVGTVLIWHTLRAGKGQKKDDDKGGSDDSKEGKKKKGGKKAKKSEGEEEETSPPPPANMAGKVGEQATPIGSDPSPQGGLVITVTAPNNPVVVAVPTDPAADKTNPSLLPQDVLPDAGAPAPDPVSPVQMVPIEANQEDNPKSQTGPQ